jgi:hypothetical protein
MRPSRKDRNLETTFYALNLSANNYGGNNDGIYATGGFNCFRIFSSRVSTFFQNPSTVAEVVHSVIQEPGTQYRDFLLFSAVQKCRMISSLSDEMQ